MLSGAKDPAIGARHLDDLFLHWRAGSDVEREDVFIRIAGNELAIGVIVAVIAAGQHQQCPSIGAECRGDCLACGKIGVVGKTRIERAEYRSGSGSRRDRLALDPRQTL